MSKSLEYLNHIKNNDFNIMITTYPPIPAYNGISKPEMFNIIRKELTALEIIKEKPFASASTINYIKINKDNPNMLDYEHYCMTIDIKYRVNEEEFNLLKEALK